MVGKIRFFMEQIHVLVLVWGIGVYNLLWRWSSKMKFFKIYYWSYACWEVLVWMHALPWCLPYSCNFCWHVYLTFFEHHYQVSSSHFLIFLTLLIDCRSKELLWWGETCGRDFDVWLSQAAWHRLCTVLPTELVLSFCVYVIMVFLSQSSVYCEYWCFYSRNFSFNWSSVTEIRIARNFNTYGPRMNIDDGRVVSNFIAQALR